MKVFWSWQAHRSPRFHKFLVRDALQDAIDCIVEADAIEAARPEVDHDTLNEPGSPDIVQTITRKIAEAAVFVADVTPEFDRAICAGAMGRKRRRLDLKPVEDEPTCFRLVPE